MDSLTQLALGAAVGEAVLGSRIGRRGLLWGAVFGTLPDLDVLIPMGDAVANFTYHRSWSHSIPVLSVLSPGLGWLASRWRPLVSFARWTLFFWLTFATHVLIDALTVYGTQVWWPSPSAPVGAGSMFIIDPAYTLPLLAGLGWVLARRQPGATSRVNAACLALSSLYLLWSLIAQAQVRDRTAHELERQGLSYSDLLLTPAPLNTLLWRAVALDGDRYHVGYRSLLDGPAPMDFRSYDLGQDLLEELAKHPPVARLQWFTKGFLAADLVDGEVVLTDLRMGREEAYVFRFAVARMDGEGPLQPQVPTQLPMSRNLSDLGPIWRRILDPKVPLPGASGP